MLEMLNNGYIKMAKIWIKLENKDEWGRVGDYKDFYIGIFAENNGTFSVYIGDSSNGDDEEKERKFKTREKALKYVKKIIGEK